MRNKNLFTVISTFAGGGGSSTGYRQAGGNVLAINEFVPAARKTYAENYPEVIIFPDDIRDLNAEKVLKATKLKVGELDILDGSPPCASFSSLGVQSDGWGQTKQYSDTEQRTDDLFFEYARLIDELRPKMFIAENVKNLMIGDGASLLGGPQRAMFDMDEGTIFKTLSDLGYNVRYKVLNALDYGVPQNRERLIITGVRNDINFTYKYPKPTSGVTPIDSFVDDDLICISVHGQFGEPEPRVVWREDSCYAITAGGISGKNYRVLRKGIEPSEIPQDDIETFFPWLRDKIEENHTEEPSDDYEKSKRLRFNELKGIAGFPADYKLLGTRTKKWERVGRAVPPPMMREVAKSAWESVLKPYYESLGASFEVDDRIASLADEISPESADKGVEGFSISEGGEKIAEVKSATLEVEEKRIDEIEERDTSESLLFVLQINDYILVRKRVHDGRNQEWADIKLRGKHEVVELRKKLEKIEKLID